MIAYKIDNCDTKENLEYLELIKEKLIPNKKILEFGLECYKPRNRSVNLESDLLKEIGKIDIEKICHLSLNNKLFNIKNNC